MSQLPDHVWVNVNPSLRCFDQPLLNQLARKQTIAEWQYSQTLDEPASLEIALTLLHDYLKSQDHPVHLLGHSNGGLVSLLYTYRHPERVKSLTLLSVGAYPAIDWKAHYYVQLNLLLCSPEKLLNQMVYSLFGRQSCPISRKYRKILEEDLLLSLSPHSLFKRQQFSPISVSVPLLVCAGEYDMVVDPNSWQGWKPWLKEGDRLFQCPKGRYFFHHAYPGLISQQIFDFWQSLSEPHYFDQFPLSA
ncbi:MAG: alpha/beta fold hydrolase [Microcystaceae cyanobacterium]